jgi:CubicO group peptidase (beta-lactamase class C family)
VRRTPLFPAAAIAMLLAVGCRSAARSPSPRLDALFSDLYERGLFSGAVVVSGPQGVIFAKGYGLADAEERAAFTPDTPADGGSLAKTFTAALLLALEDEGLLSLDDPAQTLLPELPYPQITLRDLLRHTSGLLTTNYEWFDGFLGKDEVRTTEALLGVVAERKPALHATPGTAFEYSSFAYDLALLAAARAAGKPAIELLTERFFRPLQLASAFARPGRLRDFPQPRTLGYQAGKVRDVFDLEAFHGGSNLYLSARDLDRWNRSFFEARTLSPRALARAHELATIGNDRSGLTWGSWYRNRDATAFWYSGHLEGFHDEVFRDTVRRRSIVYVSNNTIQPWLQKGIIRAVRGVMTGVPVEPLREPAMRDVTKEDRPRLAGTWEFGDGDRVVIDAEGTSLFATRGGIRYRVIPVASRWFYIPGLDWILGVDSRAEPFQRLYRSANDGEAWALRHSALKSSD